MNRKTAEQVTFITDTWGGRRAVGELREQIALFRAAHPGAAPIVQLAAGKMPTKNYGLKPRPVFKVTDWTLVERREPVGTTLPVAPPAELDDDIPF